MSKLRLILVVVILTSLTVVVTALLGLATNQASDMEQWPAPFDLIQRHAWRSLGIGVTVSIVLGVVMYFVSRSGPQPASKQDVATLHDRFDVLEIRTDSDTRMERLPPYAYDLLMGADAGSRDRVWQLIAPFTDDAVDPRALAEELVATAYDHGEAPRRVRLRRSSEPCSVRVEVDDTTHGEVAVGTSRLGEHRGRGVVLVAYLSAAWSVEFQDRGKTVWAEVSCSAPPPAGSG